MKRTRSYSPILFILLSLGILYGCDDSSTQQSTTDGGVVCGDSQVGDGEKCDDGNTKDGDGCSADCKTIEAGYKCPATGGACTQKQQGGATCGNGNVEAGEKCDDGNKVAGDGCSDTCTIELGYTCATAGQPCTANVCGDGHVGNGETCDDGNTKDGDGCSADCKTIEAGYICPATGGACTQKQQGGATCGNGNVEAGETCDDGNKVAGDGCSDTCTIESGYTCATAGQPCTATCGDGKILGNEKCDDGNKVAGDGCTADCSAVELGFECPPTGGACTPICGDGKIIGSEKCDDGNKVGGDGCAADCSAVELGYACTTPGKPCTTKCGDGFKAGSEKCDEGIGNKTEGCSTDCKTITDGWTCDTPGLPCTTTCGDGKKAGSEKCDDGNKVGGDGCAADCSAVEPGYACTTPGKPCTTKCGDGKIAGKEQCDEGPGNKTDGCSADCKTITLGWTCATAGQPCKGNVCGDGHVGNGEACDDSNTTDSDGCSADCSAVELGYTCATEGAACFANVCGDGHVGNGEACDDGNTTDGDGCSGDCSAVELGYECPATGGACTPKCGDGIKVGSEKCDTAIAAGQPDACPATEADCRKLYPDACLAVSISGSACDAACVTTPVSVCANGDGCCPASCNRYNDDDCIPVDVPTGGTCDVSNDCKGVGAASNKSFCGHFVKNGICLNPCANDADCINGDSGKTYQCTNILGGAKKYCVQSCANNSDCRADQQCKDVTGDGNKECWEIGVGTKGVGDICDSTSECSGGQRFECSSFYPYDRATKKVCTRFCNNDVDCGSGAKCDTLTHECIKTCTSDTDCPSGSGLLCSNLPGSTTEKGCQPAPAKPITSACTSDSDCGSNSVCVKTIDGGYCTQLCDTDADCTTGSKCGFSGTCEKTCASNSDCTRPTFAEALGCVTRKQGSITYKACWQYAGGSKAIGESCTMDSQCSGGANGLCFTSLHDGYCTKSCTNSTDCGAGSVCNISGTSGICLKSCPSGISVNDVCDSSTHASAVCRNAGTAGKVCYPPTETPNTASFPFGKPCTGPDKQCPANHYCGHIKGVEMCVRGCNTYLSGFCPFGSKCKDYGTPEEPNRLCVPTCTSAAECSTRHPKVTSCTADTTLGVSLCEP